MKATRRWNTAKLFQNASCYTVVKGTYSEVVDVHATKAQGGMEVYIHSFLTTVIDGVSTQFHTPAALAPGERGYTTRRRVGGSHSRCGRYGEEINFFLQLAPGPRSWCTE